MLQVLESSLLLKRGDGTTTSTFRLELLTGITLEEEKGKFEQTHVDKSFEVAS